MKNYKTGKNYAYPGLPSIVTFDEYVAFMGEMSEQKKTPQL